MGLVPVRSDAQEENKMMNTEQLMGIKKPDMTELKEVKVKLPVRQLLKLHYLKLTSSRTFSEVVAQALAQYFEDLEGNRPATE